MGQVGLRAEMTLQEWELEQRRIMGILMKRLREKGWLDAVQGKSKG